jgi:hypothetical protein
MSTSVETNLSQIKQELALVGAAKFTFLFWDIYDSELYTPSGKYQQNETQVLLEITYLRNIKSKDLVSKTVEQWQYIGIDESEYREFLSQLEAMWPDIKVGDELAFYTQDKHSLFYLNEKHIGTITSQNFGEIFKSIWLSESTSQPKLREALLAGNRI